MLSESPAVPHPKSLVESSAQGSLISHETMSQETTQNKPRKRKTVTILPEVMKLFETWMNSRTTA